MYLKEVTWLHLEEQSFAITRQYAKIPYWFGLRKKTPYVLPEYNVEKSVLIIIKKLLYSYFDTDCPTKVTMLIGILGSDSLELLGRGSQCLGKKNRRRKKKAWIQAEKLERQSSYHDPENHYPCYLSTLLRLPFNLGLRGKLKRMPEIPIPRANTARFPSRKPPSAVRITNPLFWNPIAISAPALTIV